MRREGRGERKKKKRHGPERGNVEKYGNMKKKRSSVKNLRGRSVKEGEVEQKMRQGEGGLE